MTWARTADQAEKKKRSTQHFAFVRLEREVMVVSCNPSCACDHWNGFTGIDEPYMWKGWLGW